MHESNSLQASAPGYARNDSEDGEILRGYGETYLFGRTRQVPSKSPKLIKERRELMV